VSLTPVQLEQFVAGLVAAPERWQNAVRHASDIRVYEQVWDDEDVNAWVICWSEDQDTGFHDHDESSAAIAVVSGQVREDRLRLGRPSRSRNLGPGSIFTVPAVAIHRVLHAGTEPAVTLHAYSPPLVRTGAYRIGAEGELERELLSSQEELRPTPALS
jgi:mannose-6-phosphate isomerase-like protein (cupin superfamily)